MGNTVQHGEWLFNERPNAAYDVLTYTPPGLMVDIGAAAGAFTRLMLEKSPKSRVVAYEPFSGNLTYLQKVIEHFPNAEMRQKALGNRKGNALFYNASTVASSAPQWAGMTTYSSIGRLLPEDDRSEPDGRHYFDVDVCRLDDEFDEPIRFVKVDIQGGESKFLEGASRLLSGQMIDMMLMEFGGEPEVLDLLIGAGYYLIDTAYTLFPRDGSVDLQNWIVFEEFELSTGRTAYRAWPDQRPMRPAAYAAFFASEGKRLGHVETDLLCVSELYLRPFMDAAISAIGRGN